MWRWTELVRRERPDLLVRWATFSLREVNRAPDAASLFDDPQVSSISVLSLALSHAARHGPFERYHRAMFDAMHANGGRKLNREDVVSVAREAGVDVGAFETDPAHWVASVRAEHDAARSRWGVFGTPTLALGDSSVFLRIAEVPEERSAAALWDALWTIAVAHPELLEIKRPSPG